MKFIAKSFIVVLSLITVISFSGCGESAGQPPVTDREGNAISVPENIEKIVSLAPATTEVLVDLGLEDKLVAVDEYSKKLLDESASLPVFDIMNPDAERLADLETDIIFATGMSKFEGEDPLRLLSDMGVCVAYIPTSKSIKEIREDIFFISEITGTSGVGRRLVDTMDEKINEYAEIGKTISDKRTVYFEVEPSISFGRDVFLDEIINLIGAVNILENETSWINVSQESVVSANPDVILTSSYTKDVDEIKSRQGFETVNAVISGNVYYIDTNSSNYANHNIVNAMEEIARAVYPEEFENE